MSQQPITIINPECIDRLEKVCLERATFLEITGVEYPWEIDSLRARGISRIFQHYEKSVQRRNPESSCVCFITDDVVFWISVEDVPEILFCYKKILASLYQNGPMPIWKMTTAELLVCHLKNVKRLILLSAYDFYDLEHYRARLNNAYPVMYREFYLASKSVLGLLDSIKDHDTKTRFALSDELIMLERCRITYDFVLRGERRAASVCYSIRQLNEALTTLENRIQETMPGSIWSLKVLNHSIRDSFRRGEAELLKRTTRWGVVHALTGCLKDHASLLQQMIMLEKNAYLELVSARENELGITSVGQEAIDESLRFDREEAIDTYAEYQTRHAKAQQSRARHSKVANETRPPQKQTNRMAFFTR